MVRGRRARAHEKTKSAVTLAVNGSKLIADDQYCASPKRKDSRIDDKLVNKRAPKITGAISTTGVDNMDGGGGSGVHQRNIKDMFRSGTRSQAAKINANGGIKKQQKSGSKIDNDDMKLLNGTLALYTENQITIFDDNDDEYSKQNISTTNIFLQEPVLSLNVDKSPNQPSSIKINKTLEVDPIFSPNNFNLNLNGQFNKIVTLNNSPNYDNTDDDVETTTANTSMFLLNNNDSNSCDSGVVIDAKNDLNSSTNKRRKPATPHRILCPSPVKYPSVEKSSTSESLTALSSSETMFGMTEKHCQNTNTATACHVSNAQKRHPKSRRRLNTNHSENSSMTTSQLIGGIILSRDTLRKINNSKNNNSSNNVISLKPILNSAKNPTAEQNTNNNYKLYPPSNQQKRNNGQKESRLNANPVTDTTNKKLTDYFPVRRSIRKTKQAVQEEIMRNIEKAIIEGNEDGLKIEYFEGKGRGIVAERVFKRGEFVVEYIGDLITMAEANQREKKYSLDENAGCYMYYFKHRNQQYCIDATAESGKLGRLVNHSRNGNLITKIVVVKNRPHLVLIAKDDIQPGEELTYDYGDRSKEALLHHPWLAL